MSRKNVQRFCGNDMHQNRDPKRVACIRSNATRFSRIYSRIWLIAGVAPVLIF
jgi:hypothetical protein